jgi:hypothetical protein
MMSGQADDRMIRLARRAGRRAFLSGLGSSLGSGFSEQCVLVDQGSVIRHLCIGGAIRFAIAPSELRTDIVGNRSSARIGWRYE